MTTVLYVLFALSVLAPIYTYAVYPLVLKLFKAKEYRTDTGYKPRVSVVIVNRESDGAANEAVIEQKRQNIIASDYPTGALTISVAHSISELNEIVLMADGELVLFTDTTTELDEKAITNLVARFSDERIGCVCGQLRKRPDKDGNLTDGVFWKYEYLVKRLESRIGRLSGANNGLYAVRKSILTPISENIISLDFYISTLVLQTGWDVVMAEDAIAYKKDKQVDGLNFEKHVQDGSGYYQALRVFWKLLLPRKGCFTYVSHRVMKWFVWVNMMTALVTSAILAIGSWLMLLTLVLQMLLYLLMALYWTQVARKGNTATGAVGKILSIALYFTCVSYSSLIGFFNLLMMKRNGTRMGGTV